MTKRSFLISRRALLKPSSNPDRKSFTIEVHEDTNGKIRINYDDKGVIFPMQEVADYPTSPPSDTFTNIGALDIADVINKLYAQVPFCSTNDELRPALLCGVFVSQNGVI